MENIEYTKMAYLYDKFYSKKNYLNEVNFIKAFIKNKKSKILDAGCGTGNHAKLLHDLGYDIEGFDHSAEMVDIANSKVANHFFVANLLNYKQNKKFDLIISFFAVFNHLKNYKEFKITLKNLKASLNDGGTIIIDLHNPQKNGRKQEKIDDATRIMRWHKCVILKKEYTKITYLINGNKYKTKHTFSIFAINKLEEIAKSLGFNSIGFYENYDQSKAASKTSKNIQMVLSKK